MLTFTLSTSHTIRFSPAGLRTVQCRWEQRWAVCSVCYETALIKSHSLLIKALDCTWRFSRSTLHRHKRCHVLLLPDQLDHMLSVLLPIACELRVFKTKVTDGGGKSLKSFIDFLTFFLKRAI